MHMKLSFPEWRPFSPGRNELRYSPQLITVTSKWARWRLKSPVFRLFTQPFIQVQLKENNKALRHWPLCGEFSDQWAQMASNAEKISIWWRHHVSVDIDSFAAADAMYLGDQYHDKKRR